MAESGTVGGPPIADAVADALAPFGARVGSITTGDHDRGAL